MALFNLTGQPFNDTIIEKYGFHNYLPYISDNINYNDEVRIPIQELDSYTLSCNSYLDIVRKLGNVRGGVPSKLKCINNGITFLFRELRYDLNDIVIDSDRNVRKLGNVRGGVPSKLKFINNGIAFLFRELRYHLNGIVIDSDRNVGLASTMKNFAPLNRNESISYENAECFPEIIMFAFH